MTLLRIMFMRLRLERQLCALAERNRPDANTQSRPREGRLFLGPLTHALFFGSPNVSHSSTAGMTMTRPIITKAIRPPVSDAGIAAFPIG